MPFFHDYREPFDVGQRVVVAKRSVAVVRVIASDETMCIYLVRDDDGNQLVMKEILSVHYYSYDGYRYDGFRKYKGGHFELDAQTDLSSHPNVVQCFGGQYFKEDHARFHMLMEYAPFGDLNSVIKECGRVKYHIAWNFYDQITSAIGFMHREERYHSGVGPRNVFVFSTKLCKLGDFGNGGFLTPAPAGVRYGCQLNPYEAADICGAAWCVLYMLLGDWILEQENYCRFLEVREEDEVKQLFHDKPAFAESMAPLDCWYLRLYFDPLPRNSLTVPIPEQYGTTRKQIQDQIVDDLLEAEREEEDRLAPEAGEFLEP